LGAVGVSGHDLCPSFGRREANGWEAAILSAVVLAQRVRTLRDGRRRAGLSSLFGPGAVKGIVCDNVRGVEVVSGEFASACRPSWSVR
jgi:hypothetical protein